MNKRKLKSEAENKAEFKKFNTWYSEDIEEYKKWADSKRQQTKFTQEHLTSIFIRGCDYIQRQYDKGQPLTISGLQSATGCNRTDFHRMKSRDYDWRRFQLMDCLGITEEDLTIERCELLNTDIEYYITEDGVMYVMEMYSDIIERFYLEIEIQLEELLYKARKPTGAIFLLKSVFGWSDRQEDRPAITQNIHVATREEAEAIMRNLTLEEIEEQRHREIQEMLD